MMNKTFKRMIQNNLFMKKLFLLLLIILSYPVSAQNLKKGFKLLEKADYEKSIEVFRESYAENKENPAALFGLALVLADEKSPYYDLIEAWDYAGRLTSCMESLTPEEIEFIGEYFYNTEAQHISRPVKKKMEYAIETVEAKLIKYIREENNLEIVYKVLEKFPDFRHHDNVIHIRNQLEFRKYEKQNTLEGYLEFISKFPDAAQVDKAVRYRNKLAFENTCTINTVAAFQSFLKEYPGSVEYNLAIKKLNAVAFEDARRINTIAAFDKFMSDYPEALEVSEARLIQKKLLYEYAKKIQTIEAYNEFIQKYPEGQQYIDIFNLKSLDKGMQFLRSTPFPSNNIQWARCFDEEGNEEQTAVIATDTLNSYILGGTVFRSDTGSADAWILKLSSDGKMIWNKYIGEEYNDEVNFLSVNNRNEILGAGNTWLGTDSASREAWLFKLGSDGQKMWSKRLGNLNIRNMLVTPSGSIFMGGYQLDDSAMRKYAVLALNENGRRLWSRTYTGTGEVVQISECKDQQLLITGNHWSVKTDPRGYLVWETSFQPADSIIAAQVLPQGSIYYVGFRNRQQLVLIKAGADGKTVTEKELLPGRDFTQVYSFTRAGQNQMIVLAGSGDRTMVFWINSVNGEIIKSSEVSQVVRSALTDRSNNLLLAGCNKGLLLIRNNGPAF
jgi:hypothetical protein